MTVRKGGAHKVASAPRLWLFLLLFPLVFASPALAADFGSLITPGELSSLHKEADGISNCTKCHIRGSGITNSACLECHKDVSSAIDSKIGYHASVSSQKCIECHTDHKGKSFSLVDWSPKKFDHSKAGYNLTGKHSQTACEKCHKTKTKGGAQSYLGAQTACKSCHEDVHKGEFKEAACDTCHNTEGWKWKYVRFDHNKPYPLDGKHEKVPCLKCHPVKAIFLVPEKEKCVTCHLKDDKHKGKLGPACEKCHKTAGWKDILMDHSKTRYPLVEKHLQVACEKCHVDSKKTGSFKLARFDVCDAPGCHDVGKFGNVHEKQFVGKTCDACHNVAGFKPSLFKHEAQAYVGFKLAGKHAQTACVKCHRPDPITKVALFKPIVTTSCDVKGCHDVKERGNIHGLQFKGQKCDACHNEQGWKPTVFRHNDERYAGFKLLGKHEKTECSKCHVPDSLTKAALYKPLNSSSCDARGCHDVKERGGVHGSQFKGLRCETCHNEQGWKPTLFKHSDDRFQIFRLVGKHEKTPCEKCHRADADTKVVKYRPIVSTTCDWGGCHDVKERGNVHGPQFKRQTCDSCHNEQGWKPTLFKHDDPKYAGFKLLGKHEKTPCEKCHPTGPVGTAVYKPINYSSCSEVACHKNPHGEQFTDKKCEQCHNERDWKELTFNHKTQSRFPLEGKHIPAKCDKCHANKVWRPLAMECINCHKKDDDKAHGGKMGDKCVSCHTAQNWEPNNFFHDVTGFKLQWAHKQIACTECHKTKGVFAGLGPECTKCHTDPHLNQFGPAQCSQCHTAKNWYAEKFNHGFTGFRLEGGHRAASCEQCHKNRAYRSLSTDCYRCHQKEFTRSAFHAGQGSTNCVLCHKVYGWNPASFFHKTMTFTGYHKVIQYTCTSCHTSNPPTTANLKWAASVQSQCSVCHTPPHPASGAHSTGTCPTSCDLCHNTSNFTSVSSSLPSCKPGVKHGR
ncbi:MAG: hypothetical protein HY280_07785 [Nitrospinae bacterium]|nr:hypothetical protein [Nitrospinota bacterium]